VVAVRGFDCALEARAVRVASGGGQALVQVEHLAHEPDHSVVLLYVRGGKRNL
jgi:hypothetical protein